MKIAKMMFILSRVSFFMDFCGGVLTSSIWNLGSNPWKLGGSVHENVWLRPLDQQNDSVYIFGLQVLYYFGLVCQLSRVQWSYGAAESELAY